ncbi:MULTISPECIES: hypothetical protein [unclassified Beijerinckia]|uniref:bestrophin-like domain n=1 Tax=unclassified Beijerinckia TaxID=2638183 RepID=UPI00089CCDBC|nr:MULTISPECIES: hypothetical protein [unclassified Beijerinckia]MDH7796727.1 hypothetical protein [Beijerinckia sp. GAS462]SEC57407.1 hypothetical protein SAMN05443249_3011 [Beijerinckia sp. 28-YEA-48]
MEMLAGFGFLLLFCFSALVGALLRGRLDENHLSKENMDALRLVTGLLVTFAALVLSLQLSSSRTSFSDAERNRSLYAGQLARLGHCLRDLGPPLDETRLKLRQYTAAVIASTWPREPIPVVAGMPDTRFMAVTGEDSELTRLMSAVARGLDAAGGADAASANTAARCRTDFGLMQVSRWAVIEDAQRPSAGRFIRIISFWLSLVFLSFGLQVPRRKLSWIVLAIGVVSIASVMFVIVDLDVPYGGFFGIQSTAMRNALADMSL